MRKQTKRQKKHFHCEYGCRDWDDCPHWDYETQEEFSLTNQEIRDLHCREI